MLRNIYVTRRDLKLEEKSGLERAKIAKVMGHSIGTQQNYLWHTYVKENPDRAAKYGYYSQDPKYKGEALGGQGIDVNTGLPKMNTAESHVLSSGKKGGGVFGYGDIVFPNARKEYTIKLNKALENKLITKEKYDEAVKNFRL